MQEKGSQTTTKQEKIQQTRNTHMHIPVHLQIGNRVREDTTNCRVMANTHSIIIMLTWDAYDNTDEGVDARARVKANADHTDKRIVRAAVGLDHSTTLTDQDGSLLPPTFVCSSETSV